MQRQKQGLQAVLVNRLSTKRALAVISMSLLAPFAYVLEVNAQELPSPVAVSKKADIPKVLAPAPRAQAADTAQKQMHPGVRYTVGSKTVSGWEKELTNANKNLGNFYWAPMTHMLHTTPSAKTSAQAVKVAPPKKAEYQYVKPVHAALPVNPSANQPPKLMTRPESAVAQHLAPPVNTRIKDVSAKVTYKKPQPGAAARQSVASSQDVNGQLLSKDSKPAAYSDYSRGTSTSTAAGLTSTSVRGNLITD